MTIQRHNSFIPAITKLFPLVVLLLVSSAYAEDEKTELLKKKSIELTDFVYSEIELHQEDRRYIEDDSYAYLKGLVKLLEKDLDRSTSKFQFQLEYLNKVYIQDVSKSIIDGNNNGPMYGARNGGGKNGVGGRNGGGGRGVGLGQGVAGTNNNNNKKKEELRKKLKVKVAELLKDFDLDMPTGGKKKEGKNK